MTTLMQQQLKHLVKLQALQIEMAKRQQLLDAVPAKIEALEKGLDTLEAEIAVHVESFKQLKDNYRAAELDIQATELLKKKSKEKLSAAKSNKEYRSCLKEISSLEEKISRMEELMIAQLDDIDTAQVKSKIYQKRQKELQADTEIARQQLSSEAEDAESDIEQIGMQVQAAKTNADPKLLDTYQYVRMQQVNKIGLAMVSDAVCFGCNMNVPTQMYNELQRGDSLKFCPNCQRIIYWEEM